MVVNITNSKIKNINKKIVAGALVFSLATVPLTGCVKNETFEYTVNEQGEYVASGKIEYNLIKTHCFLVIENSDYDAIEYYIVDEIKNYARQHELIGVSYIDIFNNQVVFDTRANGNRKILVCNKLEDYLYATNSIKASYTKEEVEIIFEQLKEDYIKENVKQKVKE